MTPSFGPAKPTRTRIIATNPIAFDAVASIPAIGAFVPEYASGAARWNGAALTLNPNATSMSPTPIPAKGSSSPMEDQLSAKLSKSRLPDQM